MFGAVIGAVVGGVAGAVGNAMATNALVKKNAKAYRQAAKEVREAANKYSGQAAYNSMQNEGNTEGMRLNKLAMGAQAAQAPRNNSAAMANAANLQSEYGNGYSLGAKNSSVMNKANYNKATTAAQQALNQANIDYKAGTAAAQTAMNTAGGLASLVGQIKESGNGQTTSDENVKEYNNHSGLPKADAEDALRQIESIAYKYKDGLGLDNDYHVGVTAQSLEGTAFDDVVSENNNGIKQLDKQKLQESIMAGIAALQKEIDSKTTSGEECKTAPTSKLREQMRHPPIKPIKFVNEEEENKKKFLNDPTYGDNGKALYRNTEGDTIHTNPDNAEKYFGNPTEKYNANLAKYNAEKADYDKWLKQNRGLVKELDDRDDARAKLRETISAYKLADRKNNAAKKYYNDNIYKKNVTQLKNGDFDDQVLYEKYSNDLNYSGKDDDEALEQMKKDGLKVSKKDREDFLKEHNLDNSFQQAIYDRDNNNDDEYDPELLRLLDMNEEDYLTDEERPEYERLQQQLKDIDKEDIAQEAEDIIEKEPEAADILPDNNPLKKEAEQVNDDNPHNSEVNNEEAKKGLDEIGDDFFNNYAMMMRGGDNMKAEIDNDVVSDDFFNNYAAQLKEEQPQQQSSEISDSVFDDFVKQMKAAEETPIDDTPLEEEPLSDDFFENYAAQLKEEQPLEEEQPSVKQEQPKQKAISINDIINGTASYEDFRKEGQRLLQQAEEHRKQARQKMINLTDRKSEEGTPWGDRTAAEKGYIGSIGLKSGREFSKARFINGLTGAIDQLGLSEEERLNVLSDKKLMAQIRLLEKPKRRNKVTPEDYQNQIADLIANRNNDNTEAIVQSVAEQLDLPQEAVQNAPVEDIIEESEFVEDIISDKESLIDWNKVKVYEPGEDPYYQVHDSYDPRVEKMWDNYDDDEPSVIEEDDSVVDYGLEDQNQYQDRVTDDDIARADETVYDPLGIFKPELTDDMLEHAPELPYADNVFQVKQQLEDKKAEVEESDESEEQKERKMRILDWLTAKPNGVGSSSSPSVPSAPDYHIPGNIHSGVAVGTNGLLPHGALSYSSANGTTTSASQPSATDAHQSPAAIKDSIRNDGTTVVTGKQSESSGFTSSNGGNFESGATMKSGRLSSVGSSISLPGFTGHTGSVAQGLLGSGIDNLKKALIERIKNMIDQLSPETRKEMGFSPTLYNYNGTPLNKLDGDTLRSLAEQLENMVSN